LTGNTRKATQHTTGNTPKSVDRQHTYLMFVFVGVFVNTEVKNSTVVTEQHVAVTAREAFEIFY